MMTKSMINLEIDGKPVQVDNGATVMEAANKLGAFSTCTRHMRQLAAMDSFL